MKHFLRRCILAFLRVTYRFFCRVSKVEPGLVLFSSSSGSNVFDSPYYMMRELAKDPSFRIFVVSRRPAYDRRFLPDGARAARYLSLSYLRLLARAEYLITNTMFPDFFRKKRGQILVNTWHGTPMKTLGAHMPHALRDMGLTQNQFLMADYLLYPSEFTRERIMSGFFLDSLYAGKVVLSGYPRNTAFFDDARRREIRGAMGLDGRRVFVYMPTWRGASMDERKQGRQGARLNEMLQRLDPLLADDVLLYVKLHPYDLGKIPIAEYGRIRQAPDNYEPYEFLNAADGLISDYSSVIFDYADTGRDIVLFPYDLDAYCAGRGLYIEPEHLPFPVCFDAESLAEYLNTPNPRAGNEPGYRAFKDLYCPYDSAENARTLNDVVFRRRTDGTVIRDCANNGKKAWKIVNGEDLLRRCGADENAETASVTKACADENALNAEGEAKAGVDENAQETEENILPLFSYEKFSEETVREIRRRPDQFRLFAITHGGEAPYGVKRL
jgi:CDP-glycerol glycerophosphotransferase (TagB/SpsB family)